MCNKYVMHFSYVQRPGDLQETDCLEKPSNTFHTEILMKATPGGDLHLVELLGMVDQ